MPISLPLAQTPNGQTRRGHAAALKADTLGYVEHLAKQGDFLKVPLPLTEGYFINHPDLVEAVMVKQSRSFNKPFTLKYAANQFFGDNLFTSDGDLWRTLRSTLQPGFSVKRMAGYAETIVAATNAHLASWHDGATVDVTKTLLALTLATTTTSFFGLDLSQQRGPDSLDHLGQGNFAERAGQDLIRFTEVFSERTSTFPLPAWVPTPINRELKQMIRRRDQFFLPLIEKRRASGEDRGDVLSMLIQAQVADQTGKITDLQVCNEVSNLFAAGYEVTAYSLSFVLYLLSQHPDIETRLLDELTRVLDQRQIAFEDLEHLLYLEQVIKEGMRLFPVAAIIARQAIAPVPLTHPTTGEDHIIPKNGFMLMAPWVLHRRPDVYPEPLRFDPDRFAPDQQATRPKMAYLPFSGGPRSCIGQGFAMMQMKINLAMILQRYRLTPVRGYEFKPVFNFNTRPQGGLPVVLSAR